MFKRFKEEKQRNTLHMEAAMELEDDVFFADISRQISLLIMDDDEEDEKSQISHCPLVNLQAFPEAIHPSRQASFLSYDHQLINFRTESKGTGVFIPRTGKNTTKQTRFTASSGNERPSSDQNSIKGLPQMACNNSISPSYHDASILRRF